MCGHFLESSPIVQNPSYFLPTLLHSRRPAPFWAGVGTRTEKVERAVVTQKLGPTKGRFRALRLGGPQDSIFWAVAQDGDGSSLTHYRRARPMLQTPTQPVPPIQPQGLSCTGYLGWGVKPRSGRAAGPLQGAANTRS